MGDPKINQSEPGRAAASNRSGRYEKRVCEAVVDEWSTPFSPGGFDARGSGTSDAETSDSETSDAETQCWPGTDRTRTTVSFDSTRSIVSRNDSPDIPFDRSVNPYRGCEHGCIYCFARPGHAYLGMSPGLDFETKIVAKPGAADLLRRTIRRRGYDPQVLALGAATDPYQPVDRQYGITRQILQVLAEERHPVAVVTKSDLVLRDLDLLQDLAADGLAQVYLSVTTLDAKLARRMEPRASTPTRRLHAIGALHRARVPVGVLASPMIPGLNDSEIEAILQAAGGEGARRAGYVLLRLPMEVADLFGEWLQREYPDRADRVLSLVRQTRGGRLYQSGFDRRQRGTGPVAEILRVRFEAACRRYGLDYGTGGELSAGGESAMVPKLPRAIAKELEESSGQLDLFGSVQLSSAGSAGS